MFRYLRHIYMVLFMVQQYCPVDGYEHMFLEVEYAMQHLATWESRALLSIFARKLQFQGRFIAAG